MVALALFGSVARGTAHAGSDLDVFLVVDGLPRGHAVVVTDPRGVLAAARADLRTRRQRLGSKRIWTGTRWHWDLKPDYRRGDIFEP